MCAVGLRSATASSSSVFTQWQRRDDVTSETTGIGDTQRRPDDEFKATVDARISSGLFSPLQRTRAKKYRQMRPLLQRGCPSSKTGQRDLVKQMDWKSTDSRVDSREWSSFAAEIHIMGVCSLTPVDLRRLLAERSHAYLTILMLVNCRGWFWKEIIRWNVHNAANFAGFY